MLQTVVGDGRKRLSCYIEIYNINEIYGNFYKAQNRFCFISLILATRTYVKIAIIVKAILIKKHILET